MQRVQVKFADGKGRVREAVFDTESPDQLRQSLTERGYYIIQETSVTKTFQEHLLALSPFGGGVSLSELTEFSQLLRTLLKAGLPLKDALDVLLEEQPKGPLPHALNTVLNDISEGISFSRALGRHPSVFPDLYVRTVVAGEKAGALEQVLERVIGYYRSMMTIRRKLMAAMIYPAILLMVSAGAITFMLVKVFPEFSNLFQTLDVPLPPLTQVVVGTSDFVAAWFFPLFGLVILAAVLIRNFIRTPSGRRWFDRQKLRIPLIRTLEEKYAFSQFSRTLSTLIEGGIPLIEGLQVVIDGLENKELAWKMRTLQPDIERGDTFAKAMRNIPETPAALSRIIHVGEESGQLAGMLNNLADHYDEEIEALTSTLTSLIEPLMFLMLTAVVGTMIVALLLPIMSAASNIR